MKCLHADGEVIDCEDVFHVEDLAVRTDIQIPGASTLSITFKGMAHIVSRIVRKCGFYALRRIL